MSKREFVVLTALLMSLVALTIDMLLPALPKVRAEYALSDANQAQYVISAVFLGMIVGNVLFGPLSDSWGRKRAIGLGLLCFISGALITLFADSFALFVVGRTIQGIGVAAPRVVCVALVRDQYDGREMARIMSLVMMVFILVPAIAPAFGQLLMLFASWRVIPAFFVFAGVTGLLWFMLRQPETLPLEKRTRFTIASIIRTIGEVLSYPAAVGYALSAGFIFAAFVGYLVSSQQVYDLIYHRGTQFPFYFGALALVIGSASTVNARFVIRHGMRRLSIMALSGLVIVSGIAIIAELASPAPLAFVYFVLFCLLAFFCVGILFGNLNSMAMEPLGHIAGVGSAVIGAGSTLVSVGLGTLIGQAVGEDVLPVLAGFLIMGLLTLVTFCWVEKRG